MSTILDPLRHGLPSEPELEKIVLGCLLTDDTAWPDLAEIVTADCFSISDHRCVFSAIRALAEAGEHVDRVTVAHQLGDDLRKIGGLPYLIDLDSSIPKLYDPRSYGQRLQAVARKRAALEALYRLYRAVEASDSAETQAQVERVMSALAVDSAREWLSAEEIVDRAGGMNALLTGPSEESAIIPPWPRLAEIVPAFCAGQFVVIAANTGVGKTIALNQVAVAAAEQGLPVRMASLEMMGEDIVSRMACNRASVSIGRAVHGQCQPDEQRRFMRALGEIYAQPLKIRDGTQYTVAGLSAALRKERGAVRCVVVDYIGLMEGPGRTTYERISGVTRALKRLAMDHRCAVIAAAQVSRASQESSGPPELRHLRDSGSIEQDADIVLMLHEGDECDRGRRVDMWIRKQRRGPKDCFVPMVRVGKYSRLEEL